MKKDMTGIILSGGKNSRMGVNKAFLEICGNRLIDKILDIYKNIFTEIIIVTNDPLSYTEFSDTIIVTDIYKGNGPLGGIYTGLFYAKNDYAFISACDMPSLNKDFILYMTEQQTNKFDIIVPELPAGFQPLHAIYSRRCLPSIKKMIISDKLKIADCFKEMRLLKITAEKIKLFDEDGRLFLNINTPDDLKKQKEISSQTIFPYKFLDKIRKRLRYFITNPLHFRYMEQYFNSPYGISLHRDRVLGEPGSHDILMDIFVEGIEQQILKEFPKAALFSLAFGPLISLMRDHILGFVNLEENLIRQTTEACWDGIKRQLNCDKKYVFKYEKMFFPLNFTYTKSRTSMGKKFKKDRGIQ